MCVFVLNLLNSVYRLFLKKTHGRQFLGTNVVYNIILSL